MPIIWGKKKKKRSWGAASIISQINNRSFPSTYHTSNKYLLNTDISCLTTQVCLFTMWSVKQEIWWHLIYIDKCNIPKRVFFADGASVLILQLWYVKVKSSQLGFSDQRNNIMHAQKIVKKVTKKYQQHWYSLLMYRYLLHTELL